jgi:Protein of unknown function (DUF3592)
MKSASAIRRENLASAKENRVVRITVLAICVVLLPVAFYSLLQNHRINRLRVSGVKTTARVTKENRLFGEWWKGHPSDGMIVVFSYADASGKSYEGWEKVRGLSAAKLNPGDAFPVWYDPARPNRFLTPWTDNYIEARMTGLVVLLLAGLLAAFLVTRSQRDHSKEV